MTGTVSPAFPITRVLEAAKTDPADGKGGDGKGDGKDDGKDSKKLA